MPDALVVAHSLENALGKCQVAVDVPLLDPQAGEPDTGLQIFLRVGELLWYYCSPVCGSPTQQIWDLIFHDCTPPTVSLQPLLCLQTWYIFFWWVPAFSYQWLFNS